MLYRLARANFSKQTAFVCPLAICCFCCCFWCRWTRRSKHGPSRQDLLRFQAPRYVLTCSDVSSTTTAYYTLCYPRILTMCRRGKITPASAAERWVPGPRTRLTRPRSSVSTWHSPLHLSQSLGTATSARCRVTGSSWSSSQVRLLHRCFSVSCCVSCGTASHSIWALHCILACVVGVIIFAVAVSCCVKCCCHGSRRGGHSVTYSSGGV